MSFKIVLKLLGLTLLPLWAQALTAQTSQISQETDRLWTSADGQRTFYGRLISYNDPNVTVIRRGEWQRITFNINELSIDDQREVLIWAADQPRRQRIAQIRKEAETNANRNAYSGRFKVVQVLPDGVHAMLVNETIDPITRVRTSRLGDRIFIRGNFSLTVAEDEVYNMRLFWTGSFTYRTVEDRSKTIRSYMIDWDAAVEFWVQALTPRATPTPRPASTPAPETKRLITGYGTAFAITPNHLVTNAHVVDGGSEFLLHNGSEKITAHLLRIDRNNDIALLVVEDLNALPLPLRLSSLVSLADSIFVAGFPNPGIQGHSIKVTDGIISSLTGINDDVRWYQISAPVQPGNSGGPVLDTNGRVVAIVNAQLLALETLMATGSLPQNVNYAIRVEYLVSLLALEPTVLENVRRTSSQTRRGGFSTARLNESVFLIETTRPQ